MAADPAEVGGVIPPTGRRGPEKMLAQARAITADSGIEYRRCAIEDIDFLAGEFEVVTSSLAFHYVERFDLVCQRVHRCLVASGRFVFSVRRPTFTALAPQG